ncbi:MAG: aldo/keto reductase [Bryobacterales bacterium]|nr:aldo/keto reductase [Bryobacterales bacterium]
MDAAFGWTGERRALIGQGTWMIEQDPEASAVAALQLGIDSGMTIIDTAEMYGNGRAEQVVGKAIKQRREKAFLVSKVLPSNASYDGTRRACERSLRHLGVDHLDLYLLHWPGSHPIAETMRGLESLVNEGMTRFIGVSNFDTDELGPVLRALKNERLACNQVLYHLGDRGIERRLIPFCRRHEIAVMGYSPFGHRSFPRAESKGGKVLGEIASRTGKTVRQVALQFLTRDGCWAIPKSGNREHVRENAGALNAPLTEEDAGMVDKAFPAPDRDVPLGII